MIKITVILLVLILTAGFLFAQEEAEELEKEKAPGGMTFWQTIKAGGTAMVFIGLCSVLAVAITVERIISMKPAKVMPMGFVNEVSELVKQRKYYEAKGKCDGSLTPVSNVLGAALGEMDNGKEATVAAVEDAGAKEMTE
ncbi:hypothetical protein KAW50_06690, partial [candidate division WOR-3 bacterium]|nr:hypothetical protein [candidate division WOR-3 bacterium]